MEEPQNWSAGDHSENNLTVIIPVSAIHNATVTAKENETVIVNGTEATLEIKFRANVSNEPLTIKKSNSNPANKSAYALESLDKFIFITSDAISDTMNYAILKIYYNDSEVQSGGIDELSLKITYWNETAGNWMYVESYVNAAENYVRTNITHFSLYGLFGLKNIPMPMQNSDNPQNSNGGGSSGTTQNQSNKTEQLINDTASNTTRLITVIQNDTVTRETPESITQSLKTNIEDETPTGKFLYNNGGLIGGFLIVVIILIGWWHKKRIN